VFEQFTDRARRVLVLAQEEARLLNHGFIGTEHILLGLLGEGEGVAAVAMDLLGVSSEQVRSRVQNTAGRPSASPGSPPFTPRAKHVLELALRESLQLGHTYIGTEHILLGLVREGEGTGAQILIGLGFEPDRIRHEVVQLLSGHKVIACSLCGRRPPESGQLINSENGAFVCEHCINDLTARLATDSAENGRTSATTVVVTGRVPADQEAARTDIALAFQGVFVLSEDRRTVPCVDGGDRLGPCLKEAQERHAAMRRTDRPVTIESVQFVDEGHAVVSFAVSLEGLSPESRRGSALVVGSSWKVARATFCELMDLAGVRCPPSR
jgi:hypothetical protein